MLLFGLLVSERTSEANNKGISVKAEVESKSTSVTELTKDNTAFKVSLTAGINCKNGQDERKIRKQRSQPVAEESSTVLAQYMAIWASESTDSSRQF